MFMRSGFKALQCLSATTTALYLDFDGTLADIVAHPDGVCIEPATLKNLARLYRSLDGAFAIVTGRDIATLDRFLAPHVFPVSGVHGFEMRSSDGQIRTLTADRQALAGIEDILASFVETHDGLLLERKPGSLALHYRQRPDLVEACRRIIKTAIGETGSLQVLDGKMVIEVKAHGGNKGKAITAFLDAGPFQLRRPVFIGDDVTDEAAFEAVNARQGLSIKVGAGHTKARYRLRDASHVRSWLGALADQLDCQQEHEQLEQS